ELRAARPPAAPVRLVARRGDAYEIFDALAVARFSAADKYVLCRVGGREVVLDESLADLERRLLGHDFMRVPRGGLVHLREVRRVTADGRSCTLELADGQRVGVSRRLLPELRLRLGIRGPG